MNTSHSRPLRILHVIDPENPHVGHCVCKLLADAISSTPDHLAVHHDVLLVGGSAADRIAARSGLATPDRIGAGLRQSWNRVTAFRRYVRSRERYDIVQTWSMRSLTLAMIANLRLPISLYLSTNPSSSRTARWLRILASERWSTSQPALSILAISNTIKRAWVEDGGIDPARVHVIRPGIDFGSVGRDQRVELRRRWGVRDDDTFVIGAAGHPVAALNARRLARLIVLAHLNKRNVAAVLAPGSRDYVSACRVLHSVDVPLRFVVHEYALEPWNLFAACDAALIFGDDTGKPSTSTDPSFHHDDRTGPLPLIWAAAAGTTIIGEASYGVSEIIEHNHSGFLVRPGDDNALVQRISAAAGDSQSTWSIRDAARSEAFSFFSRSRFATDLITVYRQITSNDDISVPDLPSTGGLRFAGRA